LAQDNPSTSLPYLPAPLLAHRLAASYHETTRWLALHARWRAGTVPLFPVTLTVSTCNCKEVHDEYLDEWPFQ
jgi:hypothetical protein